MFIFQYFSEYDIRMFILVFWLRNMSSIKYVHNLGNGGEVIQKVYRCVQKEGVEKSVMRQYILNEWPQANVAAYFLCIDLVKYNTASPPAKKITLFSSITITIIRIIRIQSPSIFESPQKKTLDFLKRRSYTNIYLKFLCNATLITLLFIF